MFTNSRIPKTVSLTEYSTVVFTLLVAFLLDRITYFTTSWLAASSGSTDLHCFLLRLKAHFCRVPVLFLCLLSYTASVFSSLYHLSYLLKYNLSTTSTKRKKKTTQEMDLKFLILRFYAYRSSLLSFSC